MTLLARGSHPCSAECRAVFFFFSSRRRHTRLQGDWSSDVCSSDLASQAVQLAQANDCPAVLIAELRHTRADLLRQVGRDRESVEELNATANTPMPPALRSRFLHLKALLLERHGAPQALEHLLESYQQDR